jgi:hypothetical protein
MTAIHKETVMMCNKSWQSDDDLIIWSKQNLTAASPTRDWRHCGHGASATKSCVARRQLRRPIGKKVGQTDHTVLALCKKVLVPSAHFWNSDEDFYLTLHGALSRIAPLPSFTCSLHTVLSRTWKGFHWDWPLSRCERKQRLLLAENRLQARWRDEEADCVLFDFGLTWI